MITVTCNSCGKTAQAADGRNPDAALECACCPQQHDHAGKGCRPVTIYAVACLTGSAR